MPMRTSSEVDLRNRLEAKTVVDVEQGRELDPVSRGDRELLEGSPPDSPLPRKRLDHSRELRPMQRQPRPGDKLGDATPFE